jgi:hypothetical protein
LGLLLPQLPLPLFLFPGQVMTDGASGHGADDRMMACHMSGHRADGGTLDAPARLGLAAGGQNHQDHEGYRKRLLHSPGHGITP